MKCFRFSKFSGSLLLLPALLCSTASADEFATVPSGDAIYSHLSALARYTPGRRTALQAGEALTRYEAALQTGRIIVALTELEKQRRASGLGPDGANALRELVNSLSTELRLLDVDPEAALALANRAGKPTSSGRTIPAGTGSSAISPSRGNLRAFAATPRIDQNRELSVWLRRGDNPDLDSRSIPLSPRLRAGAALLAMQRETLDPFGDSAQASGFSRPGNAFSPRQFSGTGAAGTLSYNFNSWLSVRAMAERRSLLGASDQTGSQLSAPLFRGADEATAAGGGVDVAMGPVRLSTEVSRVSTDVGTQGTKFGGGLGISAWQNRLSLSAHLARLKPVDSAAMDTTATELNVGLDISQRLSLGMQYQGLFTEQPSNNTSRVAGGLTLNF